MAGEIEEPLRFNFQADLVHSGSISFGRFESESLSWERRSSFSHNRYLEEVEKYSKPGSVTEKKAYFEAHFKRKAFLKQSSSESQDGREVATSETDDPHDFQESETGNDSKHFTCFDESPHSSGHFKSDQETEIQIHVNQKVETLCTENTNVSSVDYTITDPHQNETANVESVKREEITEVTVNDSVVMMGMTSEMKQPKPKLKGRGNYAQVSRIISSEASNVSTKPKIRENKGLTVKEKVNKSPRPASSIELSGRRTLKSEESSTSFPKAKLPPVNKSIAKEYRSEKSLPGAPQTGNRTKQIIQTPRIPHVNQTAAGFTFKSDQRAERRKEEKRAAELNEFRKSLNFKATPMPSFYKESGLNYLNYQEKRAAELNEFRKSLNFKATPMPSFYKESGRSLNQNKAISSSKTPTRPRTASMAPSTPRFASMAPSTRKVPSSSTNSSNPRPSSTSLTNRNRFPEPSRRVQEKKKDLNLQKQKQHEAIIRSRVRETKGVHTGTGLKQGCIAVGVAT